MNKRLLTLPVLAALLLAAGSGVGFAIPSLGGPTGIVSVPTAAVAPANALQAALSYQTFKMEQIQSAAMYQVGQAWQMYSTSGKEDFTVWSLQALTGITDKAELWAAYSSVRDTEDSHLWGIGGKILLTKEPEEAAALAVGASYQKWANAVIVPVVTLYDSTASVSLAPSDVDVTKLYLVATKDFTPMKGEKWEWGPGAGTRMLGSLGLMYLKADPDVGESNSLTRPFLGFEFVGAGGTTLGLEYRWKDSDLDAKAIFSAVLRHRFSPEVTAEVGTTNASPIGNGLDDQEVFVRVGYSFPMKQM
jgi:hypothetical protein